MNEFSSNFDWNHARAFLATAENGSLSKAALKLQQSQPTIGRQIAALENALGVLLFDRVGHRLILTEKGRKLLAHVQKMNQAAEQMSLSAQSESESVEGHVTLTLSDNFAAFFMPQILLHARDIAPKITIDIHAQNALEDLTRREADIAIRHVRPTQADLIAKRLPDMHAHLYGAPSYLQKFGNPRTISEVENLDLIAFGKVETALTDAQNYGLKVLPRHVRYGSDSGIVAWEMARAGLGLIFMSDLIAQQFPEMIAVLPEHSHVTFPVWLVSHRELQTNRRMRTMFDLLAESLSEPVPIILGEIGDSRFR